MKNAQADCIGPTVVVRIIREGEDWLTASYDEAKKTESLWWFCFHVAVYLSPAQYSPRPCISLLLCVSVNLPFGLSSSLSVYALRLQVNLNILFKCKLKHIV